MENIFTSLADIHNKHKEPGYPTNIIIQTPSVVVRFTNEKTFSSVFLGEHKVTSVYKRYCNRHRKITIHIEITTTEEIEH